MGKIADEPVTMSGKAHAPTSEQLRIAQLLGDKGEDNAAMREKCQKVMETTGCTESKALITLHDCNNSVEEAVCKILDGSPEQGEWTVQESRKPRKLQNYPVNNNSTASNDDYNNENSEEITNTSSKSSSRRGVAGASDGPPRLRGRGSLSRGKMPRGRRGDGRGGGGGGGGGGGNMNENNNESNVNFDEHSSDRGRRSTRNRGGRELTDRGRGRGVGARGSGVGGRRHASEQVFEGGMSTWSNEPESNTWDNSMANSKWPANNRSQQQQQQQQPIDEWNGGGTASKSAIQPNNSNTWDNSMAQSVGGGGSAAGQTSATNHIDEWSSPDDWGGEEDWQSMKGRVFTSSTNMVQQQQQNLSSMQSTNNSTFSQNVVENRTSDPTGMPSHMRGESIDVKSLFGPKTSNDVVNDVSATGSWTKQATDTLKNELGIGKVVAPNIDQTNQLMSRDSRQFGKTTTAKVEMPNSVANIGPLDVEFGEFSSVKMRNSGGDSSTLFEFGSTAGFVSSDLTMPASSTKDQSGKNVTVYQRTAPSTKESQLNGSDILLPVVAVQSSSAKGDGGSSKTAADILSSSYPNAANTFIGQDHQSQFASRSTTSLLVTNQQQKTQTGIPPGLQSVNQLQRSYLPNNAGVQSSTINESQLAKDTSMAQSASIQSQNIASGLGYNTNANRTTAVTSASKPQINPAVMNPVTNQSYQAAALATALPYMDYQSSAYLNALGILSPQGIPFNPLAFDMTSLGQVAPLAPNVASLRDMQGLGAADVKQQYSRTDGGLSGATNSAINAPPGLGPATANNAEQAAQLMPQAAAYQYSLINPMQSPYLPPFVVPTITNTTSSTVSSNNQYGKSLYSPIYYSGSGAELQMQLDYNKSMYGVSASQSKPTAGSNMSLNANDVGNKAYPGLKTAFDGKSFQTATPPPGISGFPTAFQPSAAGAFGAYPGFLPPHGVMNMMPPNIPQAASLNTNDVMSGGSQRAGNPVNKNANLYGAKNTPYWNQ